MDGIGKSLRERSEMTFADYCKEVVTDLLHVNNWIEWGVFGTAIKEAACLVLVAVFFLAFPVTVPLGAFVRMKNARKRFQQEADRHARVVARMQSRVQKIESE